MGPTKAKGQYFTEYDFRKGVKTKTKSIRGKIVQMDIDQIVLDIKSDLSHRTDSIMSINSKNDIYSSSSVVDKVCSSDSEPEDDKKIDKDFSFNNDSSVMNNPLPSSKSKFDSNEETITGRELIQQKTVLKKK